MRHHASCTVPAWIVLAGFIIVFTGCCGCTQYAPPSEETITLAGTVQETPVQTPGGSPAMTMAGTSSLIEQPAETPVQDIGSLVIWCPPSACSVYIDGTYAGDTPAGWGSFTRSVRSGLHDVKVAKIGYADFTGTVYVSPGKPEIITANLSENPYPYSTIVTSAAPIETDASM